MGSSTKKRRGVVERSSGLDMHQAQDCRRPSKAPGGTAGMVSLPVHQAPEQGRRDGGAESGSDGPASSRINGSTNVACRPESSRDVTRCEQPAFAADGASKASARSVRTAPAGFFSGCQGERNLIIYRVLENGSPVRFGWGQAAGEVRQCAIQDGREFRFDTTEFQVVSFF